MDFELNVTSGTESAFTTDMTKELNLESTFLNQSLFDGINYNCTKEEIGHPEVDRALWFQYCNVTIKCKPQEYYSTNYRLIGTLFQSISKLQTFRDYYLVHYYGL